MNERELSLIKALGDEFGLVLSHQREHFSEALEALRSDFGQKIEQLSAAVVSLERSPEPDYQALIRDAVSALPTVEAPPLPDISAMVQSAIDALPAPTDGKSVMPEEVTPLLQQMVDEAFRAMPAPKDGKDFDPEMLKQAVADAVGDAVAAIPIPKDGKSVTPDDIAPLLQQMVTDAVNLIPAPTGIDAEGLKQTVEDAVKDAVAAIPAAKPGDPGRDALALELLPHIEEEKSYPRGTYATHNGGLWRSYEKTFGMRGWECIVDGVSGVAVENGERSFCITIQRASGATETKSFDIPVMLYRGVFKSGLDYLPGDTVTWGGSLWHCDTKTQDKPGETGSAGWTLAAKRGRDGRDKT